jgi:hypothetical protein
MLLCLAVILSLPSAARADSAAGGAERAAVERQKRFMQRALDDLAAYRQSAEEDIGELERQRSAIALLEPSQRERDLDDVLDWYYRYYDWLTGEEEAAEGDLARLSAPGADAGMGVGNFREMADKAALLAKELNERVKGYTADRDRLAVVLDRRRQLQDQFRELEADLARLGRGESESLRSEKGRKRGKRDAAQIRADIRVVQTELLTLPDIDEDILKHYTVLIEQGEWEGKWLTLAMEEYDALGEVAALLPGDVDQLVPAYRRLIRAYNKGIRRLAAMGSELDRKGSRLSAAGTIREMDRTRDLTDLYDRLRHRFDRRRQALKVQVGACEAELAEIRSLQP